MNLVIKEGESESERNRIRTSDLVELEPLVIRRIKDAFHVRFTLGRVRPVGENKIEIVEYLLRPFSYLFLENFSACSESMQTKNSWFPHNPSFTSHLFSIF